MFDLKFANYPNRLATILLAIAIYANFFTHHFFFDVRYILFAVVAILYGRTWVTYTVNKTPRRMPLLVAFVLIAFFIWIAENIATYVHVWLYPSQLFEWHMVSLEKMGSWLLLMIISFIMVDILHYMRKRYLLNSRK